jgi:hypothetical protein
MTAVKTRQKVKKIVDSRLNEVFSVIDFGKCDQKGFCVKNKAGPKKLQSAHETCEDLISYIRAYQKRIQQHASRS